MSYSGSKSDSLVELKKLRRRVQKLLAGGHPKHPGPMNGTKEALKVARLVAIKSDKSRNFQRALEKAYGEEEITCKSGSVPFTQLAKLLFVGRGPTIINRYARVLAVAEKQRYSASKLRALLDDESIESIARLYPTKTAEKETGFSWSDAKRALHRYGSFRVDEAAKGWHVALIRFKDGKASVYQLPDGVGPDARILAKRASKAAAGPRSSER